MLYDRNSFKDSTNARENYSSIKKLAYLFKLARLINTPGEDNLLSSSISTSSVWNSKTLCSVLLKKKRLYMIQTLKTTVNGFYVLSCEGTTVVSIYFSPGQVQGPAILSGSICSWFPVRWSTFRCGNRPRFNILSPVKLLKDKSNTWNKWIMSSFFDHHNILSDICL